MAKSIVLFAASSFSVTSEIGVAIVGGSSTALTVIENVSEMF
jgi:hypothetical protein